MTDPQHTPAGQAQELRDMASGIELLPVPYDDEAEKLREAAATIDALTKERNEYQQMWDRAEKVAEALSRQVNTLTEALSDLHAEVEMAESVGICLPDRVPSLRARDALASAKEIDG